MLKKKVIFSWSGGKDSTLCLHHLLQDKNYEVVYLLTSIQGELKRVSLHGIHESLIEAQAQSIGIPLKKVYVYEASNEGYEREMSKVLLDAKQEGINTVVFGDIFLEDLRAYREDKMKTIGMETLFPMWKKDTFTLVNDFLDLGYKTIVCCVNDAYLSKDEVGVEITKTYIENLPQDVDPCGENGEFHTYCFEGPIFKIPINIEVKEKLYKDLDLKFQIPDKNEKITKGFWYANIELEMD
jgi:uncharacterized protein (TIGR00290 family)